MEKINKSTRIEYIDAIRGFTMTLVVYSHLLYVSFDYDYIDYSSFNSFFRLMRMPLFFFISGFIFYKHNYIWNFNNIFNFISKKTKVQIISTAIFFTLFTIVLNLDFIQGIKLPTKYGFWFTITLFEFFIIALLPLYLEQKFKMKKIYFEIFLIIYSVMIYSLSYPAVINTLNISEEVCNVIGIPQWRFFIYFTFGITIKRNYTWFIDKLNNSYISGLIIIFLITFSILFFNGIGYGSQIIIACLAIIVTFGTFRKYERHLSQQTIVGKLLQYIGRRTLDIYLIHNFILPRNLQMIGHFFESYNNPIIEFTFTIMLSFIIIFFCILISNVLRISPFLANILFGVKKNKSIIH